MDKRRERIYVCHTFYHVYVACLKELNLPETAPQTQGHAAGAGAPCGEADGEAASGGPVRFTAGMPKGAVRGGATLVLSRMSNDFGDLDVRARSCGLFEEVIWFDEKPFQEFEELLPLKKDTGSLPKNMANRMKFCRRYGQLEEPYVPVDFSQYGDIYVFCDSDPIGYFLSYKKIRYHAVEDGLDCIRYYDTARWDNRGHFALKARMASRGLIFIQNGYGKYCIDMEVNDVSAIDHPAPKMIGVPREKLVAGLSAKDRELLIRLFIANRKELEAALRSAKTTNRPAVLILTEPLCADLNMRRKLFGDMIDQYGTFDGAPGTIVIKPHPRDVLNYHEIFPQHIVLDAKFPMEILNFLDVDGDSTAPGAAESADEAPQAQREPVFRRVVTVYTVPNSIHCAKEKIYLGNAWMDKYEDKSAHAHVTDHRK